ncbi:MAG: hypothetical protein COV35_06830 [Alphaproteobacteria bacterium CG11_big_fil_rev_8_21_14_0_20_39_49]|nr:MAG: hypothetical protein COV35_06830 [Alphaproteobacteria bacterium CG11_big_fil_rev_8_21_14_0_20_39_49]
MITNMRLLSYALILISSMLLFSKSHARPVIADLSLRQIAIDSGFKGDEILLFGARNDAGDVVVVVRGPKLSYIMRKKEKMKAGIWANNKHAIFENIPGYYNAASSRPVKEIKNDSLLKALNIGLQNIELPLTADEGEEINKESFQKAFLKKQEQENLYFPIIGNVEFIGDTLFRTIIKFPENIPRGIYTAEVYLFSDGQLSGLQSTPLIVKKKGFDAFIYDFAYRYPLFYGIIAVLLALAAGWIAGAIFRKV